LAGWILTALLLPMVVVVYVRSDTIGLSSSEEFIREKLGGSISTAHVDVYYPLGAVKKETAQRLATLHEFYYQKLCRTLSVPSNERIVSFLYASAEQKERFTGAASTDYTKPWLRQMHINIDDADAVLEHEMTHVLAGEFGWSPLRIGHTPGLTEGLAVAITGTEMDEPLHHAAALAFVAEPKVDPASLFTMTGFARQHPNVTYTLAGSFCRYLLDTYGLTSFRTLYQTGDFVLSSNVTVYCC
jgi:hypothetical protein